MIGKVLGGTAIVGVLAAGWRYVKMAWEKLYSLVVVTVNLNGGSTTAVWTAYFWWSGRVKTSRFLKSSYFPGLKFVRPLDERATVVYERVPANFLGRIGKVPVFIGQRNDKDGNSEGLNISFIRGTMKKEDLVLEMAEFFDAWRCELVDGKRRFYIESRQGSIGASGENPGEAKLPEGDAGDGVQRALKWTLKDLGPSQKENALDKIALSDNAREAMDEARKWMDSRDWFRERGIPWKRGWQLYGPPGTGKTMFVRCLGQELDLPILSLELSTFTNRDMHRAWMAARNLAPCIVLIEDIDTVFDGRTNIAVQDKVSQGVSFGTLLNCIDGVDETDGIFLIITTNNPEVLDPAIGGTDGRDVACRPGRIDRVIEMKELDANGRRKIAARIDGYERHIEDVMRDGDGDTGAQFQERCQRLAYSLWERDHNQKAAGQQKD